MSPTAPLPPSAATVNARLDVASEAAFMEQGLSDKPYDWAHEKPTDEPVVDQARLDRADTRRFLSELRGETEARDGALGVGRFALTYSGGVVEPVGMEEAIDSDPTPVNGIERPDSVSDAA